MSHVDLSKMQQQAVYECSGRLKATECASIGRTWPVSQRCSEGVDEMRSRFVSKAGVDIPVARGEGAASGESAVPVSIAVRRVTSTVFDPVSD